jgi:histidinol phosphatase-like enzyme
MVKDYLNGNNLDYSNSYVIGDKLSDIQFGRNLGINQILLLNDRLVQDEKYKVGDNNIDTAKNLLDAVFKIIKNEKNN